MLALARPPMINHLTSLCTPGTEIYTAENVSDSSCDTNLLTLGAYEEYSICPVCLCVPLFSLFCLLALLQCRHPTRLQRGKCSKIKKPFSLKLLSSTVRNVINLLWLSYKHKHLSSSLCRGFCTSVLFIILATLLPPTLTKKKIDSIICN